MKGSREQSVWFRFQQVVCNGSSSINRESGAATANASTSTTTEQACRLHGIPLYFDTYWWSRALDGKTGLTGT